MTNKYNHDFDKTRPVVVTVEYLAALIRRTTAHLNAGDMVAELSRLPVAGAGS